MSSFPLFLFSILLTESLVYHNFVCAAQVNQTIDDTHGDLSTGQLIVYTPPLNPPPSRWVDQTCQGCSVLPNDPSKAFMGTFHGATSDPSAGLPTSFQLDFTGTAIYVFFTLVNNVNTFVNFTIDNTPAGFFTYNANTESTTQYQVPVFSRTNLQNSEHSLLVSIAPSSVFSYINFDYAHYTQDDGTPESILPSSSSTVPTLLDTLSSQPSSSLRALMTHSSIEHPRAKNKSFTSNGTLSRGPSTSTQPSATISTVIGTTGIVSPGLSTTSTASTLPSTPGSIGATGRQTRLRSLAIAGAVLGPITAVAAAALLLRYIHSRNQATLKKQDSTPFTEVSTRAPSFQDAQIFGPISKRKSRSRISAVLSEKVRDALRRTRQDDIDQRLRTLRGEIVEISSTLSARGAMVPANGSLSAAAQQHASETGDESASSRRLRRMLYAKQRQIEHLEQQRQSPWALGLSDESPVGDANSLL